MVERDDVADERNDDVGQDASFKGIELGWLRSKTGMFGVPYWRRPRLDTVDDDYSQ